MFHLKIIYIFEIKKLGNILIKRIIKNHHQGKYSIPFLSGLFKSNFATFFGLIVKNFGVLPYDIGVSIKPAFINLMENGFLRLLKIKPSQKVFKADLAAP